LTFRNGNGNGRRDVNVFAPAAGIHAYTKGLSGTEPPPLTPELQTEFLREELRRLQLEFQQAKVASATMANMALCFAQMLADHGVGVSGEREVTIPRWLSDRMVGWAITVRSTDGEDIVVSIRERERVGARAANENVD
jgi:hypothetical protein